MEDLFMEKKTIGQFIAALRKANGMTQRELAEQLNVSDKAVSRWERDESAPDLSLIPVIAEIFGVTSDEILRGERATRQESTNSPASEKGKKQIVMLLDKARNKFQMYCLVSGGIAGVGLIMAMTFNFGFYQASLGFFLGTICYLAAVVVIGIALLQSMQAIQIEEADEVALSTCKKDIVRWCYGTVLGIVAVFFLTLPFVTDVYDAYVGLNFDAWMLSGLPKAIICIVIGVLLWWLVLAKKFSPTEEEKKSTKRKLKYLRVIAIVLVITAVIHMVTLGVINEFHPFVEGTTFYHYEDFIEYMEREVSEEDLMYGDSYDETYTENIDDEYVMEEYFDEDGNVITREEYERLYLTETVRDENGEVLFTYINRNEGVHEIRYGTAPYEEGEDMPITVYTSQDLRHEDVVINDLINPLFTITYLVEIIATIVLYFQRKKIA